MTFHFGNSTFDESYISFQVLLSSTGKNIILPSRKDKACCFSDFASPCECWLSLKRALLPPFRGRNMVYGLRAQSPKYDRDQGSEERAWGSEEWDQGSQGF